MTVGTPYRSCSRTASLLRVRWRFSASSARQGASNKLRLTGGARAAKLKRGHYDLGIRSCQMAMAAWRRKRLKYGFDQVDKRDVLHLPCTRDDQRCSGCIKLVVLFTSSAGGSDELLRQPTLHAFNKPALFLGRQRDARRAICFAGRTANTATPPRNRTRSKT